MPVEVSHKLDLNPELPDKYKEIALKQGEDPNKIQLHLDELKRLIYGECKLLFYIRSILISTPPEKGLCKPHRTDDEFLLRFLRARFFKPENSYKLVSWIEYRVVLDISAIVNRAN